MWISFSVGVQKILVSDERLSKEEIDELRNFFNKNI